MEKRLGSGGTWIITLLVFACGAACAGCACGAVGQVTGEGEEDDPFECYDLDLDGYGEGGGCIGSDCNDSVPAIHLEQECDEYCRTARDLAPGCACSDVGASEACYGGGAETLGVGACRGGSMTCQEGEWGACLGQVLPGEEVCNEADDDCDGETDQGVLSPCGDCNDECEEECLGMDCPDAFDPAADGGESVVVTPEGALTIDEEATVKNHVIWVANTGEGTVSKVDTRTRVETGRYRTGLNGAADSPSRTTVNTHGDVVVVNRGGNGDATRYDASDCADRDGDGVVESSAGAADVRAFQQDECWRWTTPIAAGARGSAFEIRLGLDGIVEEYVWIGDYTHFDVHEIDAQDGFATGRIVGGAAPYGIALGPDNLLWTFANAAGPTLLSIDTDDLDTNLVPLPAGETWYGITVDPEGRVWTGGSVARYDPETNTWAGPDVSVYGGGIACDAEGNAYVGEIAGAVFGRGGPWRIDAETMIATVIPGAGGHGWAVDFDGYAWSIEFVGTRAFVVDPVTLDVETVTPPFVSAYTYSDMTGFQLVNATNPEGRYPHVFDACDGQRVRWGTLTWDAVVPPETSLAFRVRTADDLAALAAKPWTDVATAPPQESPAEIGDVLDAADIGHGHLLEVEIILRSFDREARPVLSSMRVTRSCVPGFE